MRFYKQFNLARNLNYKWDCFESFLELLSRKYTEVYLRSINLSKKFRYTFSQFSFLLHFQIFILRRSSTELRILLIGKLGVWLCELQTRERNSLGHDSGLGYRCINLSRRNFILLSHDVRFFLHVDELKRNKKKVSGFIIEAAVGYVAVGECHSRRRRRICHRRRRASSGCRPHPLSR